MSMGKYGSLKRAISVALALSLVVTLVPAGALSFAEEAASSAAEMTAQGDSSTATLDAAPVADAEGDADGSAGIVDEASGSAAAGAGVDAGAPAGSPDEPADSSADADDADADDLLGRDSMFTVEGVLEVDESVLSITVPAAVAEVDPVYFWQFPNCERIEVEDGHALFASYEGMLYTADLTTLIAAPLAIGPEVVLAPECEAIEAGALRGVSGMERIRVSSIVSSIFMSTGDPGESANGYTDADLIDAELSAFSAEATQGTIVQIEVDPSEAIDAAFAWYASGFRNVEVPEAAIEDEDEVAEEDPAEGDAEEPAPEEGAEVDSESEESDDSATATDDLLKSENAPEDITPLKPTQVIDVEKPLETAPDSEPVSRPQMITGEYDIRGTLEDGTSEPDPDRTITTDDVLSLEVSIPDAAQSEQVAIPGAAGWMSEDTPSLPDGENPSDIFNQLLEDEQDDDAIDESQAAASMEEASLSGSTAVPTIASQMESAKLATALTGFIEAAAEESQVLGSSRASSLPDLPSEKVTTLKGNKGTITYFYIKGSPEKEDGGVDWSSSHKIADSDVGPSAELTSWSHRGGGAAGTNSNSGAGYFHTRKKSESLYQANKVTPEGKYQAKSDGRTVWLYYVNVQCTRLGYMFDGWTYNKEGGNACESEPTASLDGKTLVANWQPRTYPITFYDFYATDGKTVEDYVKYYADKGETPWTTNATFDKTVPTITPPHRNGYMFAGFYDKPGGATGGGNCYYNALGSGVKTYTLTAAAGLVLYAAWTPIDYTATFNPNGGTLVNDESQETTGTLSKTYTIESGLDFYDFPTRDGYDFAGWMVTGDAVTNGIYYVEDGKVTDKRYIAGVPELWGAFSPGIYGNVTITALWGSCIKLYDVRPPSTTYTLTKKLYYWPGYGYSTTAYRGSAIYENRSSFITVNNFGQTAVISAPAANGFVFKGFYTESNTEYYEGATEGDLRITTEGKLASAAAQNGHTSWYSQWEALEYTITFDLAGGYISGVPDPLTIKYMKGLDGPLVGSTQGTQELGYTPSRSLWEFVGWHAVDPPDTITSTRAKSGRPYGDMYLSTDDYGDITFKAVWRAKIRLKSNEEALQQPEPSKVTLSTSAIYYYTDYGFSFGLYNSGAIGFGITSNFYAKGSTMFDGTKGGFTKPTCSNPGWVYNGFGNGTAEPSGTVRSVNSNGELLVSDVPSDTTWWVWWTPRQYTATLDPSPGAQPGGGLSTKVTFLYGDTSLPGCEDPMYSLIPSPVYAGWTFDGYYLNGTQYYEPCPDVTAHLRSKGETGVPLLGDCTLTAKWVRDITVDANGGVAAASRTIQVTYGEQLPASAAAVLPTTPTASPRGVTWTLMGLYSQNTMNATQYYTGTGERAYNSIIQSTTPSTVCARWQRFVDVVANGGEGFQCLTIYKGITTAPQVSAGGFTREGYTLAGFYRNADPDNRGTKYFNSDGSPTTSYRDTSVPATVYAHWTADTSVIAFDTNGGTGGPEDIRGVTGHEITDRSMPSVQPRMDDHFFAGWFTEREGGDLVEELPASFPAGGITYHAHWTPKPLSAITFRADANGALRVEDQTQTVSSYTQSEVRPDTGTGVRISAVPDTGYAFTGWFDEKGNVVETAQENWEAQAPAKGWPASTTYTARFELDGSKIAYTCAVCGPLDHLSEPACDHIASLHALPGAFNIDNVREPLTIGAPMMRPYYRFTGWSGTGLAGEANQEITLTEADLGDKSFTVHAEAVPYTLTLDAAGGSWPSLAGSSIYTVVGGQASRTYTVETRRFQLPTPKREGYVLDHWVDSAGEAVEGSFAPGPQCYGDMTLTAVWMRSAGNIYQIEYELGDDQGPDEGYFAAGEAVYSYNEEEGAALPSPRRIGYDFLGWTEVTRLQPGQQPVIAGNAPEKGVFIEAGFTGDRIFRAHWQAHVYDVAYDLDGGAWEDPQPAARQTFVYDKDVTIAKAPVRASYRFSRWERVGASGPGAQLQPGQVLARANLIAREGSDADDDGTPTNAGTVVLRAVWTPVLSFDVGVAATGVHLGLTLDANAANPFGTNKQENWGEATIQNRTASALKVTSVSTSPQSSSLDYATLQANALKVFRDRQSLDQVSFKVRPAEGPLVLLTIPEFKLADRTSPSWSLPNTGDLSYPIGWMMKGAGDADGADAIDLYYQLNMGALTPADVNFSETVSLQVASVRFTVALVDAGEEV